VVTRSFCRVGQAPMRRVLRDNRSTSYSLGQLVLLDLSNRSFIRVCFSRLGFTCCVSDGQMANGSASSVWILTPGNIQSHVTGRRSRCSRTSLRRVCVSSVSKARVSSRMERRPISGRSSLRKRRGNSIMRCASSDGPFMGYCFLDFIFMCC